MKSELAGRTMMIDTVDELNHIRDFFRELAVGTQSLNMIDFSREARKRKDAHYEWWQLHKDDFVESVRAKGRPLRLGSWPAFREALWNEEGLLAVGTRVPPNGIVDYETVADAVLARPGQYPYCEGYLLVCVNFVYRMLTDLRSKPREPNIYDINIVLYMPGLDALVSSERLFREIFAEVFDGSKAVLDPFEFTRMAPEWDLVGLPEVRRPRGLYVPPEGKTMTLADLAALRTASRPRHLRRRRPS